jgi:polyhydroxyalkanoate synthesis regulator phasin
MNYEERSAYLSDYMKQAIHAKATAEKAYSDAMDISAEFGYEMGVASEKTRVENEIDALIQTLTDDEESAKLALSIVKEIVSRTDVEENE